MDDKQIAKFGELVRFLQSVEGQLTNLKKRVPEAAKDAAARHKAMPGPVAAGFPHWKNAAVGAAKMTKPVAAAEKAVEAIIKLHDKKKLATMKVDDLKKKIQGFMPALKAVSDEGVGFWSAMTKIEQETVRDPGAVGLVVSMKSYHNYNEYLNHVKISLGKLA